MTVELRDLISDLAVHAMAVADSLLISLFALSAGVSNGLDPGRLVVGGVGDRRGLLDFLASHVIDVKRTAPAGSRA